MGTYPMTNSNQITKDYYYTVLGMQNNGTTRMEVSKKINNNGNFEYETFHLISVK